MDCERGIRQSKHGLSRGGVFHRAKRCLLSVTLLAVTVSPMLSLWWRAGTKRGARRKIPVTEGEVVLDGNGLRHAEALGSFAHHDDAVSRLVTQAPVPDLATLDQLPNRAHLHTAAVRAALPTRAPDVANPCPRCGQPGPLMWPARAPDVASTGNRAIDRCAMAGRCASTRKQPRDRCRNIIIYSRATDVETSSSISARDHAQVQSQVLQPPRLLRKPPAVAFAVQPQA